jgi:3-methyladenine DNA glycosylase/8-oxoguanine DNA glycosylase
MNNALLPYSTTARRYLRRVDAALVPIMEVVGPFKPRIVTERFLALVRAIVAQQISTKAAASIFERLVNLLPGQKLTPMSVANLSHEELRSAGLSTAKATYVHDLAAKVSDGTVHLEQIHELDDESVIQSLIPVKGIGRWTAEMFLIFSLGRPDVLPVDDLGLRVGIQRLDGLSEQPSKAAVKERGAIWAPYRSVATWYLWQGQHQEYAEKLQTVFSLPKKKPKKT